MSYKEAYSLFLDLLKPMFVLYVLPRIGLIVFSFIQKRDKHRYGYDKNKNNMETRVQ